MNKIWQEYFLLLIISIFYQRNVKNLLESLNTKTNLYPANWQEYLLYILNWDRSSNKKLIYIKSIGNT